MLDNIYVHVIDFGNTKVAETVTHNEDDSYSIFINSQMSKDKQNEAYKHALDHIIRLDFESAGNANAIEAYVHGLK